MVVVLCKQQVFWTSVPGCETRKKSMEFEKAWENHRQAESTIYTTLWKDLHKSMYTYFHHNTSVFVCTYPSSYVYYKS